MPVTETFEGKIMGRRGACIRPYRPSEGRIGPMPDHRRSKEAISARFLCGAAPRGSYVAGGCRASGYRGGAKGAGNARTVDLAYRDAPGGQFGNGRSNDYQPASSIVYMHRAPVACTKRPDF